MLLKKAGIKYRISSRADKTQKEFLSVIESAASARSAGEKKIAASAKSAGKTFVNSQSKPVCVTDA